MKIKIFTLFLCGMFVGAVSAQQPDMEATISKTDVVPIIDGVIDELWDEAETHLFERNFRTEEPTVGDSYWKMLWTDWAEDAGVYILIWIDDDDYWPHYISGGANSWEYDKIEIYFDCNTWDLKDGLGASGGPSNGHHQIAVMYEDGKIDGTKLWGEDNPDADPIWYAHMVNDPDVIAEYHIPLEFLVDESGALVDLTAEVGFDITLIDQDESVTTARQRRVWSNEGLGDGDESWNNMDYAGLLTFEGAGDKVFVESVTLTAGDITQNNRQLQIIAEVLPEDATSKLLAWTVENVTGKAKIDENGVVTPIMDGLVTVKAAAKDGSYVEETVDINISGQIVTMPEINLIRNGYFKQVDADGTATEWTGNPDEVQVNAEGVLTIDAPPGGAEVWSYTVIQQNFGCNTTDQYWLTFVEYADESDTMNVDFEDPANGYNRYGTSAHALSNGESDWTFETEVVPTKYLFDVVFNEKVDNTVESFQLMVGKHDPMLYIDSIILYNENDLALLSPEYTEVESITVSADGDAVVEIGGTLQMLADVQPAGADYTDVYWSVEAGTGDAHIDDAGVLTGDSAGMVTVRADASDDGEAYGELEITVTWPEGIEPHRVNTLKVYPNPAVHELNIVLSEVNSAVSIYNSVGQKMEEIMVSGTEYKLDISSYDRGIYFVKTGNLVAKFIK